MRRETPPHHIVPARDEHGVVRVARQLARATGAELVDPAAALRLPATPMHVHVTDRLFGETAEAASATLIALARRHPTTLTLHDLPQADDGAVFARRAAAYASVLAEAVGWVVSSHHEAALATAYLSPSRPPAVIPLPVMPLDVVRPARGPGPPVVGVLGWIYPGKGHAEVIGAAAGLGATVRALGAASPGHAEVVHDLRRRAHRVGVPLEVTGYLDDTELVGQLAAVDVPVAAHRHISASGSINSWIAAGRRPVVTRSRYAVEMAELRPGTVRLADDADLAAVVADALEHPASTWIAADVGTAPHLADCARDYLDFWART